MPRPQSYRGSSAFGTSTAIAAAAAPPLDGRRRVATRCSFILPAYGRALIDVAARR